MLHNLHIDLCANAMLTCVWETKDFTDVVYVIIVEDPLSGEPCLVARHTAGDLRAALSAAWEFLLDTDTFKVAAAITTADRIAAVWSGTFGVRFSRALDVVGPQKAQNSGISYTRWSNRGTGYKLA